MNIVDRYKKMRKKKRYLLIENMDQGVFYISYAAVMPGDKFLMEESEAHRLLNNYLYNKRLVAIKSLTEEEVFCGEGYGTTIL